ncbi:MAG: hypothetical protein JXA73_11865 [Acidobacteria bacterium]|nr:hypothetical protein [Acidobacteriota bacterium]
MFSNDKNHSSNELLTTDTDFLESLGGEPLEGSGFEDETPELDSEWEDPR